MYKQSRGQLSLSDFNMPVGVTLNPENRWVLKASLVPWDQIEELYAAQFPSGTGNVAAPCRLALGALLIQSERQISDVEVAHQIAEAPALQFFCGLAGYEEKLPFDPSSMTHFRKRFTPELLGKINEMIIQSGEDDEIEMPPKKDDDQQDNSNHGTLMLDATCVPQNIKYPQDVVLLDDARQALEKMIDDTHQRSDGKKPRTYRKRARKDYLKFAFCKKRTTAMIREALKRQLQYVLRDIALVEQIKSRLSETQQKQLQVIKNVYTQQKEMFDQNKHQIEDRIVSLHQPWVRPIKRGKAKNKTEFGTKIDVSKSGGFLRLERSSFDAFNESGDLKTAVESYFSREGRYPARVLVDKIYLTRENRRFCKEHSIRLSGKPLGRQKSDDTVGRKLLATDCIDRIEIERAFSLGKRKFGLDLVRAKLEQTTQTVIATAIIAMNLHKVLVFDFCLLLFFVFRNPPLLKNRLAQ